MHTKNTTLASGEYADQSASGCAECAKVLTATGDYYDANTISLYSYPSLDSVLDSDEQAGAYITCYIAKLSGLLEHELGNKNRNKKLLKKIYILSLYREYFYFSNERLNSNTGSAVNNFQVGCQRTDEKKYDFVTNETAAKLKLIEYLKEITKESNTYKI